MIPGIKIQMGGNEWIVPPLTLGQLRRLEPKIRSMTQLDQDVRGLGPDQIDAVGEIVATALSRNYPDMTPEKALDLIDTGNAREVILAVLTGSGLHQGEVGAVARGNGATSMDFSPPPVGIATQ